MKELTGYIRFFDRNPRSRKGKGRRLPFGYVVAEDGGEYYITTGSFDENETFGDYIDLTSMDESNSSEEERRVQFIVFEDDDEKDSQLVGELNRIASRVRNIRRVRGIRRAR